MSHPDVTALKKQGNAHAQRIAELERKRLSDSVKAYMYRGLTGSVNREYGEQLSKWETYLENLIACARTALERHKTELDRAKEEQRRDTEMAMFILSLVGGPALSFISGAIQYRLAPKFLGNRTSAKVTIPNPKYKPPAPPNPDPKVILPKAGRTISPVIPPGKVAPPRKPSMPDAAKTINPATPLPKPPGPPEPKMIDIEVFDPDLSRTVAKVFGDLGGTAASKLGTALVTPKAPTTNLINAIGVVPDSGSLALFESNLKSVWRAGRERGKTALQNFANTIDTDVYWGDKLLGGQIPGVTPYAGKDPHGREAEAHYQGEVRKLIDQQRVDWGREWFYYGNNPPLFMQNYYINNIETEIWAMWIAAERFTLVETCKTDREANTFCVGDGAKGKSGLWIERFARKLRDLGVLEGNFHFEHTRRLTAKQKDTGLQDVEIDDIYGKVDTDEEVASINRWAMNRKPKVLGGQVGFAPRHINALNHTDIKTD